MLSAIWNELRHLVVKDDLLAGVTLRRAACHVGCHSKPKDTRNVCWKLLNIAQCGDLHRNGQFHSRKRAQEDAKAKIIEKFDVHQCQRREIT